MTQFIIPNIYTSPMSDGYYDDVAIISTNSCKLLGFTAYSPSPPLVFLQIHDGSPQVYDKPITFLALPPFETKQMDFANINGIPLANGCVLAVSYEPYKYVPVEASVSDGAFITAYFNDV